MLVVAFVSFSLFNFVGDPINNMVGEETSDEERAELRETLGLMDPIHVQFSRFIVNASKGCLLYTSPSPRDRTRSRMPSSA